MKQLIINADDYGLEENINQGILQAFTDGLVTSTTVLANGPAFLPGIEDLRKHPDLGVGVHLTLVNGQPLSPLEEVTTLVDKQGFFPSDYGHFFSLFLRGRISLEEIKKEWRKQISRLKEQGIEPTHLDSHQHLHIFPGLVDVAIELAKEFGLKRIRFPKEGFLFQGGGIPSLGRFFSRNLLSAVAAFSQRKLEREKILTPNYFYGMLWGGSLEEDKLKSILQLLPEEGVCEIMVHPGLNNHLLQSKFGWGYHWEEELASLTSQKNRQLIKEKKIELINYSQLK